MAEPSPVLDSKFQGPVQFRAYGLLGQVSSRTTLLCQREDYLVEDRLTSSSSAVAQERTDEPTRCATGDEGASRSNKFPRYAERLLPRDGGGFSRPFTRPTSAIRPGREQSEHMAHALMKTEHNRHDRFTLC